MKYSEVAVVKRECYRYPKGKMFRPGFRYPEYPFEEIAEENNDVYDMVRQSFELLGMDEEKFGTAEWNPLGDIIKPGMKVLLKPNLVMDFNYNDAGGTECLYTQPSVVAAIVDYVVIALRGEGKIIIGDAPMQDCNFNKLVTESGYEDLISFYKSKGVAIELVDFRGLKSIVKRSVYVSEIDVENGTVIDLGQDSEFGGMEEEQLLRMRVTNYDPRILAKHHSKEKHEYFISNYILESDVIINLPKPKTHRKAGVTISLKNFVGANVRKEFLPHHTVGAISEGGDEYSQKSRIHALRSCFYDKKNICQAEKRYLQAKYYRYCALFCTALLKLGKKDFSEGSWYGNDTISKTIADLNKLVYYADKAGVMRDVPVRNVLIVADMIISGEEDGPVAPSPKDVGIIAVGTNPVCFDEAICTLMGFDMQKIPSIKRARETCKGKYKLVETGTEALVFSNDSRYNEKTLAQLENGVLLNYEPSGGWKGHIERKKAATKE